MTDLGKDVSDVECLRNGAGGVPSLFSRQVPELSPSHIYCQVRALFYLIILLVLLILLILTLPLFRSPSQPS